VGSKAAIVAFVAGEPREAFRGASDIDPESSRRLAEKILGGQAQPSGALPLDRAVWPEDGVVCAASFPGVEVVCCRWLAQDRPSDLTGQISRLAEGRNAYGVFMHSITDYAGFAVWAKGSVVRSLSMSSEIGILEDLGSQFAFEEPFWRGEYSVPGDECCVLPFHPIDLANEALREFFGFVLEGDWDDSCFDPEEVNVPVFRAWG